ncbi:hypothetical protein COX09_00100 [Candidatus Beckwithbacteria bacterium CG23_combo_of_CG06-09_8_20_14_all_47_9]|uniref:Energy-coupling factor transporter transmembrane protein EcfT n=1 Tax=Candidatus Beckwithbacteria bacterium CG23_combo_of_CG06-09_8_20_14_all_47_9 TaxID=1974498 RepID=A0A2H0B6M9_9BACT|nr:MAG: hypothetical protein COX09_00100 [Candidatus Beckwithbacteria bacterium CG23_combo_of_CG06-09_8_20_14_all_47_9]
MKPYLKLLTLILASSLIINLQDPTMQSVILAGLISFLGRKSWLRLRFLLWPLLIIIIFQLWSNLSLASGFRIANLSLLVFVYTETTSAREISQVFNWLPESLRLTLTITLNLIPIIFKEAQNIQIIQSSRGKKLKQPLPLVIPLLHRTLQRSQQLAIILETRKKAKT